MFEANSARAIGEDTIPDQTKIGKSDHRRSNTIRTVCCDGHDGLLRDGVQKPLVHSGFRGGLCTGIDIRVPAGRLAVRRRRSSVVAHRFETLAVVKARCGYAQW